MLKWPSDESQSIYLLLSPFYLYGNDALPGGVINGKRLVEVVH